MEIKNYPERIIQHQTEQRAVIKKDDVLYKISTSWHMQIRRDRDPEVEIINLYTDVIKITNNSRKIVGSPSYHYEKEEFTEEERRDLYNKYMGLHKKMIDKFSKEQEK